VFPVDRPPIDGGVVTVGDDGCILAVGPASNVDGPVRDLGDVALLPGFVNTHTHLEFSDLERPLNGIDSDGTRALVEWIRQLLVHRRRRSSRPAAAIAAGVRESLAAGTTTLGEIATADAAAYGSRVPLDWTQFVEVIGFSRQRAESVFRVVESQLDARGDHQQSRASAPCSLAIGLSPHAPYTVSPELLSRLVELAKASQFPVAMHVAESEAEIELLRSGSGPFRDLLEERSMWDPAVIPSGSRPLDYLRRLADAPRALVIHGNYLDDEEHEFLASHADRMSLVHCPRTHAYFGHPPYPLAELLGTGVRVALGTDSRASNPDLSLLGEMRHVARHHPNVAPETILQLGTLAGAAALGRDADGGSITPGKWANLVALPLTTDARATTSNLLEAMLASAQPPTSTWFHGHEVKVADY
jgi:cytosine/adenosine deaminase-related metal-dependent hydrolase